MTTWWLQY